MNIERFGERLREKIAGAKTTNERRGAMSDALNDTIAEMTPHIKALQELHSRSASAVGHVKELDIDVELLLQDIANLGTIGGNLGVFMQSSPEFLQAHLDFADDAVVEDAIKLLMHTSPRTLAKLYRAIERVYEG